MTFDASAEVYDRHVGRYVPQLSVELIAVAGIATGRRVLDVGCGPGGLTAALSDRVGSTNVAAVDPSESFVEACSTRVSGADVRLGVAEELPFDDDAFDAVLSQLVVNFMSDAERGLREMARVTRRRGVVASCVWDYAEGMQMLRAFWDAALELDPSAPDEGRTMRFCREGELGRMWERCGLRDVESGALVVSAGYEDFEDYWSPFPAGVAPSGAYCASLTPDRQEALRKAAFRQLGSPNGPFTLTARAWCVCGLA